MAEQRQPFRFRLPWLPAPQPTPAPPRPSQETQSPPQPSPTQRPPFRPAGVAPAQSPTRAESQPPSQARATSQPTRAESQPPSQVRPTSQPTRAESQPPSQARATSQPPTRAESQPTLRARPTSQPPTRAESQSPSQAQTTSQPPTRAESQPPSQARPTSQPPTRAESQSPSQARPTSQPTRAESQPPSQSRPTSQPTQAESQPPLLARATSQPTRAESQPPSQARPTSQPPTRVESQPLSQARPTSQPTRAESQPPSQARATSQPPTRAESQPPSQTQATSQPPAQIQGSKSSQSPQASPTRAATKPKVSATSPPKPSKAQPEAKSQSAAEKQKGNIQRPEPQGPTELATRVPALGPEVNQTTSEGRSRVPRGMNHDEPKEKKVIDFHSSSSTSKPKGQPVAIQDEQVQHPREEVVERKVVTDTIENSRHHTVPDIGADEVAKSPHKQGSQRVLHKLSARGGKYPTHENPFSIITLSGENTGATMHLSSDSAKRERSIHIHRGYKINQEESGETSTDGEGSSHGRDSRDSKLEEELASKLYVNNNVQGVNNSLVFNSSLTERNPGVHVVVSRNSEEQIKPVKETETVLAQKAEVASITSEKLAYAPTVRRRCLRGLFLESSDSDPENPEKPRRHGCRVGCSQKGKDAKIDVL